MNAASELDPIRLWASHAAERAWSRVPERGSDQLDDLLKAHGVFDITAAPTERMAMLLPVGGGFRIKLAFHVADSWPERRWALAHELGHIYFFDHSLNRPVRSWPVGLPLSASEEDACDAFAGCLLLPSHRVATVLARAATELAAVVDIAEIFGVPLSAAARSITEFNDSLEILFAETGGRTDAKKVEWHAARSELSIKRTTLRVPVPDVEAVFLGTKAYGQGSGQVRVGRERPRSRLVEGMAHKKGVLLSISEGPGKQ